MKKALKMLLAAAYLLPNQAQAQATFGAMEAVNINNINATILLHGDMFWYPGTQVAACEYPKGSGKHSNFVSALWMSGYDAGGQLHTAAQTYRQDGNDYWPGPLDASDTLTYHTSHDWAKFWKINRTDIQYFLGLSTHTTTNTPGPILTWPAKGNTYAQGNAGAALTITTDMAPFVDVNGNGIYEPLLGEIPDIKGDQAVWWVFSDNGPAHTQSNGKPLGVEMQTMAYAYNRGTLIDNVVYFDYKIVNKSANNYSNYRIGLFDDVDLGYYLDDYIGFDSAHRMGIAYGATNDDGGAAGHPANSYGTHMPVVGITMVVLPGDAGTSYVPAGSFITYNNDGSVIGNPFTDSQFNYYLRAKTKVGDPFVKSFAGPGVPCGPIYGAGTPTNYVYTGDPSNPAEWSECQCNNNPGDRRFVITSNDFTLTAGSTQHVVMALVTTNLDTNNGCPTAKFDSVRTAADTAWDNYYNPPLPNGIGNVTVANAVHIYPNPAKDRVYVECDGVSNADVTVVVYNTLGQRVNVAANKQGKKYEVDISRLPAGLYNVVYRSGEEVGMARFVKE